MDTPLMDSYTVYMIYILESNNEETIILPFRIQNKIIIIKKKKTNINFVEF